MRMINLTICTRCTVQNTARRKLRRKAVIRRLAWALLLGGSLAAGAVLGVMV